MHHAHHSGRHPANPRLPDQDSHLVDRRVGPSRRFADSPIRRFAAFTAMEALIAAAILAVLTAAVSSALMAGRSQSQVARDTVTASLMAESLMDEIMRLPFIDPLGYTTMGPDSGETTRSTFDNIDDYAGYTDGPGNVPDAQGNLHPITDFAGNAYPSEYQTLVRSVSMSAVSATPVGWNRTITGLQITVTVSRDGRELVKLQRIAWN